MERIAQGAEAVLTRDGKKLHKERISKGYRHKTIDGQLRKRRTKREAKLLEDAKRAGVNVPEVIERDDYTIQMEFVDGKRVKDAIPEMSGEGRKKVAGMVGSSIARLHSNGIVHGDLTTSNMILKDGKLFFIDFGLGERSESIEKFAVDLRLLKEVFQSTHQRFAGMFEEILKAYKWEKAKDVRERLSVVEKRGRYVKRQEG